MTFDLVVVYRTTRGHNSKLLTVEADSEHEARAKAVGKIWMRRGVVGIDHASSSAYGPRTPTARRQAR